jgi:hypothetical protein
MAQNSTPNTLGDIINNQGIVTQGQHGNNTIIQGPVARHISSAEAESISSFLRSSDAKGIIEVMTDLMACPDCDGFAKQIEGIIRSAPNITVVPLRNGMTFREFKGVAIGVKDINKVPESVRVIVSAFKSIGGNLHIISVPPDNPNYDGVFIVANPIT